MNRKLCTFRQRRFESLSEYLKRFKNTIDQVNENNGAIWFSPEMVNTELAKQYPPLDTDTATMEQYEQAVTSAKEKYLAVTFLSGSAEHHHTQMMKDLENDYLRGNKVAYLETLTKAYEIAVIWKGPGQRRPRNASRHHELGSTFVQDTQARQAAHN